MKKLSLKNPAFEYLQRSFAQWLDVLGYCDQSVYNMPHIIREFLHYLESLQIKFITQMQQIHIKKYYDYLNTRPNQRRGGGLSDKYIYMHMQAIEKLLEYLHHKGAEKVPTLGIRVPVPQTKEVTVLTQQEIKHLFDLSHKESSGPVQTAIHARDRAMLVIYYSCALRRNEGAHLSISDINFDTRILHVRKGKNYKERYVPFNKTSAEYLQQYIYDQRPNLVKSKTQSALFISYAGRPLDGGALYTRLKLLQQQSDDIVLQQKTIGLHTLRHSIATHLLQNGMSLEKISRFLGHASLESTQLYTHLVEQYETAQ